MSDRDPYLDFTKNAFSELDAIIKKGDGQAETRKGAIFVIHQMCDALQLACDLISKELSTSIIEFNNIRTEGKEEAIRGYFQRTAIKYSGDSLRLLLHEGKVCGELHALGDRYRQPFSSDTTGSVSLWENIMTLFCRSNSMSMALENLREGEIYYLETLTGFLNKIRDQAETAMRIDRGNVEELIEAGDALADQMREKRQTLQDQIRGLKDKANSCISKLH